MAAASNSANYNQYASDFLNTLRGDGAHSGASAVVDEPEAKREAPPDIGGLVQEAMDEEARNAARANGGVDIGDASPGDDGDGAAAAKSNAGMASSASVNGPSSSADGAQSNSAGDSNGASEDGQNAPKKRNRWGGKAEDSSAPAEGQPADGAVKPKRNRWGDAEDVSGRKSRWGDSAVPGVLPLLDLTPEQKESLELQTRLQVIQVKMINPLADPNEQRSPSPEPIYDKNGVRTNTRLQRVRDKMLEEQKGIWQRLMQLNPGMKPPVGVKMDNKLARKFPIPIDKHPDYNFFGLIIGPRGNTQKRMEKETGARISIRGRGSAKDGKNNPKKMNQPGDDEPLHVYVQADTVESLEKASAIIEKLLIPVDEAHNDHKVKQLRELAAINGTLRDEVVCRVCGEKGHKINECPNRTGAAWSAANVLCTICGATTHPARDCPKRTSTSDENALQNEYMSFMAELTTDRANASNSGAPGSAPLRLTAGTGASSAPASGSTTANSAEASDSMDTSSGTSSYPSSANMGTSGSMAPPGMGMMPPAPQVAPQMPYYPGYNPYAGGYVGYPGYGAPAPAAPQGYPYAGYYPPYGAPAASPYGAYPGYGYGAAAYAPPPPPPADNPAAPPAPPKPPGQ